MRFSYKFSNLLGTCYKSGNQLFTPDGNTLLSCVGNKITCFDLVRHSSVTIDVESRSDIARLAISPDGRLLIAIDVDGYALGINVLRRVIVHRFNFKSPVRDIAFSPDGAFVAATHGRKLEVWRTPGLEREFSPFVLHRVYTGHYDDITTLDWSPNGLYLVTGSKDMTARIYSRDPVPGFIPVTLSGHRDHITGVFFAAEDVIYTLARDGAIFVWAWTPRPELSAALAARLAAFSQSGQRDEADSEEEEEGDGEPPEQKRRLDSLEQRTASRQQRHEGGIATATSALDSRRPHPVPAPTAASLSISHGEWTMQSKKYFRQEGARVTSCALHRRSGLLVVGFSSGVFGLYTMPDGAAVHTLSVSQHEIHSVAVNGSGEWIAFGSRTLGQLLVWEWRSETYILKQQGHYFDLNAVGYSPNGQLMATGADDGKVKIWNVSSGFCFVTFAEHTAPVTAVAFMGGRGGGGHGLSVVSASLDGTVRAFDLVRYRNFRTLKAPEPVQFISLATDEAGEVVCAGGLDPFSIYVWSLQTGKLLDVLAGHAAPVCSLSFNGAAGLLVSGSWDKTVRLWDVFRSGTATETFEHGSDVLAVAFRPDGAQVCASTLDGGLSFWDVKRGVQIGSIDGKLDAAGGRRLDDARTAKSSAAGKCFTSIAYTADGECLLAGGRTKYVCLYAIAPALLLRKWQISHNRSIDGILDKLHSKGVGEAGINTALISLDSDDPWERKRPDETLPGVMRGDAASSRRTAAAIRVKGVQFSPTGRAFAVASTEGLLVYSLDDALVFDPFELDEDVTPEAAEEAIREFQYARALLIALQLNETRVIEKAVEAAPFEAVELIATVVPLAFLQRLLELVAAKLELGSGSPHLEFYLHWALVLLQSHGRALRERSAFFGGALRSLQRSLLSQRESIAKLVEGNGFMLEFLCNGSALLQSMAAAAASSSGPLIAT